MSGKAENVLNETRMLILGAQVLVGFEFEAGFQPAFERLPPTTQQVTIVGLGLMLIALGLLMVPGTFHQVVERGNDTPRLLAFTGRVASLALLPFALDIGIEVYVATTVILGEAPALPFGVLATVFALFFWYGLDWAWRARDQALGIAQKEQRMNEPTPLATRITHVLTEARVVLPGAQALLGFQLAAVLTDAFGRLPKTSQYVHLASLGLIGASIVFLMAPAAFHRIVERGEDSERLHHFSSAMIICAQVPLGLAIAGDFYIVADHVLKVSSLSIGLAVASLVFFYGLWFGMTLAMRARSGPSSHRLQVSRAIR